MIKFRIGFTIESETLFRLISKVVPDLQDLSIEEMIEPSVPKQMGRIEKLVKQTQISERSRKRRKSIGIDLNYGINKILMDILADKKEHRRKEFQLALRDSKYSVGSLNSRIGHLIDKKILIRVKNGMYKLREESHEA